MSTMITLKQKMRLQLQEFNVAVEVKTSKAMYFACDRKY